MQLDSTEISELIKKKIEGTDLSAEARSEGTIVALTDGIVRIAKNNGKQAMFRCSRYVENKKKLMKPTKMFIRLLRLRSIGVN